MAYLHELEDFVDVEEDLGNDLERIEPRPIEDDRSSTAYNRNDTEDTELLFDAGGDEDKQQQTGSRLPLKHDETQPALPPRPIAADATLLNDDDIKSATEERPTLPQRPSADLLAETDDTSLPPLLSEKLSLSTTPPPPTTSHLSVGHFSTDELRPWSSPRTLNMSPRRFAQPFPLDPPPPVVLHGLNLLDVSNRHNCRVRACGSDVGYFGFTVFNNSWDDTVLYSSGSDFLAYSGGGTDVDSGRVNVREGFPITEKQIPFTSGRSWTTPPVVLCWVSGLDVEKGRNVRVKCSASSITTTSFTLKIEGWMDTLLHNGTEITWFAYDEHKKGITSGRFHTKYRPEQRSSGVVNFVPDGEESVLKGLSGGVKVFKAFDYLDVDKGGNTRVLAEVKKVGKDGFEWVIQSWSTTKLFTVGVTWIAIE